MAIQTITVRYCDLCPRHDAGDTTEGPVVVEDLELDLGGARVRLDLCLEHLEPLTKAVTPYLDAGEPITRTKVVRGAARARRSVRGREELATIRAWAREHGFDVKDRGRVPREVLDAYEAAA
jgi:hypothetical protein